MVTTFLNNVNVHPDYTKKVKQHPILKEAFIMDYFKQACWLHLDFDINRYLMSIHRCDGFEKATRHENLCTFYVAAMKGCELDAVRRLHEEDYQNVHRATQILTDNLDKYINFKHGDVKTLDRQTKQFFNKFHEIAVVTLKYGYKISE